MNEVVVNQAFFSSGCDRHPGELLPRNGPNMLQLIKVGYVSPAEGAYKATICKDCKRRFCDEEALQVHNSYEHAEHPPLEPEVEPTPAGMEPDLSGGLKPARKRKTDQE